MNVNYFFKEEKMEYRTLNNGIEMPVLGFGTFTLEPADCEELVAEALKEGYRLIDTANMYKNEKAVGRAIRKSKVNREEIFITTKLWPTSFPYEKASKEIDETLKRLGTDYIDLLLLHQEVGDIEGAWKACEEAVKSKKVKSIGISNFSTESIDKLLAHASIKPAVLQNECHPYLQEKRLREYLQKNDIRLMSWYPLGHGDASLISNPVFTEIGKKYNKTSAQAILRWHIESGIIAIPCTRNISHLSENIDVFDFELSDEDMKTISDINRNKRYFKMPMFVKQIAFTRGNINFNDQV